MRAAHIKSIAETVSLQGYSNGIKSPKDPVMISYLLIADPLNLIDTYDATADWFAPHDSYHVIRLDNYPPPPCLQHPLCACEALQAIDNSLGMVIGFMVPRVVCMVLRARNQPR